MLSRAHILIEKEINEANSNEGFTVTKLNENNIFELIASVEGLSKTSWQNGVFQVYLKFTENYNLEPPCVFFQTIPYHPNIDMTTGRPSLDFLDDINKWKPEYTITHVLKSLQLLLANPLLDRAVNMDAVFMLKGNPVQYESIVKQSVLATQQIKKVLRQALSAANSERESFSKKTESLEENLSKAKYPLFKITNDSTNLLINNETDYKKLQQTRKPFRNISYDDYCTLWKNIATTKSGKHDENVYVKNELYENPNLIAQHISISIKDLEEQIIKQLNEHKNIMYGKFDFANRRNDIAQTIMENRKSLFAKAKASNNDNPIPNPISNANTEKRSSASYYSTGNEIKDKIIKVHTSNLNNKPPIHDSNDDLFEKEVDDLINWTKNI